jgi:hypothetical protein
MNYTDPILLPNVTIDEMFANSTMNNATSSSDEMMCGIVTLEVDPTVDVDFGTDVLTLSNLVDEELQILLC